MSEKKQLNKEATKIVNKLLNNQKDVQDLKINAPSEELLSKLRKKDVPVLASPVAHG